MRYGTTSISLCLLLGAALCGCRSESAYAPPPQRVEVTQERTYYDPPAYAKPLPPPSREQQYPPPPYPDAPLVSQRMPEEQAFVNAYNAVGRPRIVVFVNRTLEGEVVPVNPDHPWGTVYLHPGQYDEVSAKSLDYEAMETILSDWLSANGRVNIVSPSIAHQRLTDDQVRELQSGRPRVAREAAQQLDAPILVQVQAHPTRQTSQGLEIRVIAEAIDVQHDGSSLARAVVDIPPPLEKTQINYYTRYLARKLMDGMTGAWQSFGAPQPPTRDTGLMPGQRGFVPPPNPSAPNPSNVPPPSGPAGGSTSGLAPDPSNPLPQPAVPNTPQPQPPGLADIGNGAPATQPAR